MPTDSPRRSAVRRLNFSSPTRDVIDFGTDPNFPRPWKFEGADIEKRITAIREALIENEDFHVQMPASDPRDKFRTEYRRILTAQNVVNEALQIQMRELLLVQETATINEVELAALERRRVQTERTVRELREKLAKLDSSVGIVRSTQLAVKSVIQMRAEENDILDDDGDLAGGFQKYNAISKLCEVALKSYDVVQKRTEQMLKDFCAARNKNRQQEKELQSQMGERDRRRVEKASEVFKDVSLEQLRDLRDKIKKISEEKK